MKMGNIILNKERAGVISKEECWVIIHSGYLYTGYTLFSVIREFLFEYKNDRHLVG